MKIAIIGSNSFIGKSIIKLLPNHDYHSYSKNNSTNSTSWTQFDYPQEPISIIELLNFDIVIYTTGAGIQSNKPAKPEDIFNLNSDYPIKLITELSKQSWKGKWISFGSYIEYGYNKYHNLDENELITQKDKINLYGESKRKLSTFLNKENNLRWLHIIIPNVYGPSENKVRLFPHLIQNLKTNSSIQLSDKKKERQYLNIKDLINFIELCLKRDLLGFYNCAPKEHHSIEEVVQIAKTLFPKYKAEIKYNEKRSHDQGVYFLGLSNKKITEEGWQPSYNLLSGLKEYLNL